MASADRAPCALIVLLATSRHECTTTGTARPGNAARSAKAVVHDQGTRPTIGEEPHARGHGTTRPQGRTVEAGLRVNFESGTISHMQELVRQLLAELGEDPSREGLLRTPQRVEKALKFLTNGYEADIDAILNNALFTVDYSEMVIVKDIDFYSLCEHHILPFFGKCHVAYIPRKRVIGLSKIPRLVDVFARRLQIQERMTNQIAQVILEKIDPLGVAVVCQGTHLCMSMRGVEKQNSFAVTSAMLGIFRDNARTRMEFLELIRHRAAGVIGAGEAAGLACIDE
jgi:GTP cyclohydrolase I